MDKDFLLEKTLKEQNPQLHKVFRDSIFAAQSVLSSYRTYFPTFTDHSILHSMNVANFCCELIGDQISSINADEIYILLMSCYLHDSGMGISKKDFSEFAEVLNLPKVSEADTPPVIRNYHHELSGLFIRKYSYLFDIPSPEHLEAIINVSRGHRKTDLYDSNEYSPEFKVPNGNTICLPYLAALIRLADEVDIAENRSISFLEEDIVLSTERDIMCFAILHAVKKLNIFSDYFELIADNSDEAVFKEVLEQNVKIQKTIDYCVDVVRKRTNHIISQNKIIITPLH